MYLTILTHLVPTMKSLVAILAAASSSPAFAAGAARGAAGSNNLLGAAAGARSLQQDLNVFDGELTERKSMTLRGGVLLAPPFAISDDVEDLEGSLTGFQGDLIDRLRAFASDDGYDLTFDLSLSPQQYGPALDLVAIDCNSTSNPHPLEECTKFDLIVGDYYCNADRSVRVDFSPTWLRTTMSTIKLSDGDFTTLTQLSAGGGTACVPEGTYLRTVVMEKFPKVSL